MEQVIRLRFEGYDDTYARAVRLGPEQTFGVMRSLLYYALESHPLRKEGVPDGLVEDFIRWLVSQRGNHPSCVYPGYCSSIRYLEPVPDGFGETAPFEAAYGAIGMPGLMQWYDRYAGAVSRAVRRLRAEQQEKLYPPPSPPPPEVEAALRETLAKLKGGENGQ